MGGRWTTRRRCQTRIEENHTDRPHEKVGYLATYPSGSSRRARYSTGGCADLKALLRDLQNEAALPPGTTGIQTGIWEVLVADHAAEKSGTRRIFGDRA